jgi:hypothetical protein
MSGWVTGAPVCMREWGAGEGGVDLSIISNQNALRVHFFEPSASNNLSMIVWEQLWWSPSLTFSIRSRIIIHIVIMVIIISSSLATVYATLLVPYPWSIT